MLELLCTKVSSDQDLRGDLARRGLASDEAIPGLGAFANDIGGIAEERMVSMRMIGTS